MCVCVCVCVCVCICLCARFTKSDVCLVLVTRPVIVQESVNTYFHCGPRDMPIGTLRVFTARELVVPVVLLRPTPGQ